MTEAIVKEAFEAAEKESREKQVGEVKKIVTKTLERLEEVRKEIRELNDERKILEMDIDDLKEGKLDRIVERQEKDPKAKQTSVVVIVKEREVIREVNPWYWPYQIIWRTPLAVPIEPLPVWCTTTQGVGSGGGVGMLTSGHTPYSTINCSVAKEATIGAYDIHGSVTHLR
jgi:regulator of replication initiation timing